MGRLKRILAVVALGLSLIGGGVAATHGSAHAVAAAHADGTAHW